MGFKSSSDLNSWYGLQIIVKHQQAIQLHGVHFAAGCCVSCTHKRWKLACTFSEEEASGGLHCHRLLARSIDHLVPEGPGWSGLVMSPERNSVGSCVNRKFSSGTKVRERETTLENTSKIHHLSYAFPACTSCHVPRTSGSDPASAGFKYHCNSKWEILLTYWMRVKWCSIKYDKVNLMRRRAKTFKQAYQAVLTSLDFRSLHLKSSPFRHSACIIGSHCDQNARTLERSFHANE